jgi:RND family efflux transporter MFP subunit
MKTKTIVTGLIVVAALAGAGYVIKQRQAAKAAAAPVTKTAAQTAELASTDVFVAQERELVQGLSISGTVKAVNSAQVKARVPGELQGLNLREGDTVKAGQVIARIESSDIAARIRQAQETADAAKAQIEIAQRGADNNKALVDQGFISKTALDTSLNNLSAARANHKAALAGVDVAKKSADDAVLRAPISGMVASRSAQNGERVGVEARIVEIVDLNRLELEAAVATTDAVNLRTGQRAMLSIEGLSLPVEATVVRISPSAQLGNRSVMTYLSIPAREGLRQGLFAQGTLGTERAKGVVLPVDAVRTDKPQPYVQAVVDGKLAHLGVALGARGDAEGEASVLVTGLAAGTQVIKGSVGPINVGLGVSFTANVAAPASAASAVKK